MRKGSFKRRRIRVAQKKVNRLTIRDMNDGPYAFSAEEAYRDLMYWEETLERLLNE